MSVLLRGFEGRGGVGVCRRKEEAVGGGRVKQVFIYGRIFPEGKLFVLKFTCAKQRMQKSLT